MLYIISIWFVVAFFVLECIPAHRLEEGYENKVFCSRSLFMSNSFDVIYPDA